MLSKETLQTALENIETHWEAKNNQMGATEKARYKRSIAELKLESEQEQVRSIFPKYDPTRIPDIGQYGDDYVEHGA